MKFSLIIPCYNEEKNISYLIKKLKKFIINKSYEVILVDNGSSDNTYNNLVFETKNYDNFQILKIDINEGYGNGILKGLQIAKGDILAWTHADLQTNPEDLIKGLKFFKTNKKDIFVKGNRKGRNYIDSFFTLGMSIIASALLKKKLWDINAQPTIFSSQFLKCWEKVPKDFSIDLYVYYLALKKGLKIYRFPVLFDKRQFGKSKWNINFFSKIKFIIRTFKYILVLKNS